MILLDTNVISALMRSTIEPRVAAFIRTHRQTDLFTASLCEAEIRYGIARLPRSRRRDALESAFQAFLESGFAHRVIPFDRTSAAGYARVRARRDAAGLPVNTQDAIIAGTALAYGAVIATRNVADFVHCGITVANPWATTS